MRGSRQNRQGEGEEAGKGDGKQSRDEVKERWHQAALLSITASPVMLVKAAAMLVAPAA